MSDAGEKMLTEERLEDIRDRISRAHPTHGKFTLIDVMEYQQLIALVFKQSATIKRLEIPVADVDVKKLRDELYMQAKSRVMEGENFADTREVRAGIMLVRQAREIERARIALAKARDVIQAHTGGPREIFLEEHEALSLISAALSLNSIEPAHDSK